APPGVTQWTAQRHPGETARILGCGGFRLSRVPPARPAGMPEAPARRACRARAWLVLGGLELHDELGGDQAPGPGLHTPAFRPVPDLGRGRLAVCRPAGS